jgi:hypothetical protein
LFDTKIVTIQSGDRDVLKYPNASEFAIELPQDYHNVVSAKLSSWSFPANYDVFSAVMGNITLVFTFEADGVYQPAPTAAPDLLMMSAQLVALSGTEIFLEIEPGFYSPDQIAVELTNKLNEAVTDKLTGGLIYDRFQVFYHEVRQKLWFGNDADQFVLLNDAEYILQRMYADSGCIRHTLPQEADWGLPSFLGFSRGTITSTAGVPKIYYSNTVDFLTSSVLPGAVGYHIQAPYKINIMGPAFMYMEIAGLNCVDETIPYNISKSTLHTNRTNGVVQSAFAVIPIPATPIQQWFDGGSASYKYFSPPKETIRRIEVRFRYHNGRLVEFGTFPFCFTLELNCLLPWGQRGYNIRSPYDQGQIQSI